MSTVVKDIIRDIEALPDKDRLVLDRELSRRLDRQWAVEVRAARKLARHRKIDQSVIDRAIARRRYGR